VCVAVAGHRAGAEPGEPSRGLFEPFYNDPSPTAWAWGLSICRSIIEAHGWAAVGDQVRTAGCSFSVYAPQLTEPPSVIESMVVSFGRYC